MSEAILAQAQPDFLTLPELAQYKFDAAGIPMKDFGGSVGWQYEPIIPVYYAQRYLRRFQDSGEHRYLPQLDRMVAWLRQQMAPLGDANRPERTIYSHYNYLPYIKAPWICGMNCGRAAELFLQLHTQFGQRQHLDDATALIKGLFVPISEGGILLKTSSGAYLFEEFGALAPALWSLNGHCSVLLSFHHYLKTVNDPEAREALTRGIDAVEEVLERFDTDVPNGGSKVKLYGFGNLRLRSLSHAHGPEGPLIRHVVIRFPNDPPLHIPVATAGDGAHAGWQLYATENSRLSGAIMLDGDRGRPFGGLTFSGDRPAARRHFAQAVLRVGLTDNCAADDEIIIELGHYARKNMPVAVDLYPSRDKKYLPLGQTEADVSGWRLDRFAVRYGDLEGSFGNIVEAHHGYHAMNTDYVEFLNEIRPSKLFADIAHKWRAKTPGKVNQLNF